MISRRTTLQAALAAVIAGKVLGMPAFAAAQTDAPEPWNWRGNAGRTGELPGPGLDLAQPLGELWRLPREEFSSDDNGYSSTSAGIIGSWNGVLYSLNGESLWARRIQDGAFLWAQSPSTLQAKFTATPTADASPVADAEAGGFTSMIAIDNGLLLLSMSNDHLWGVDAATGEFRWEIVQESPDGLGPVVVDHIAYHASGAGVVAYTLADPPDVFWKTDFADIEDEYTFSRVLGVRDGRVFVYVERNDAGSIHALAAGDGAELWRLTENELEGNVYSVHGVSSAGIALRRFRPETGELSFMMVTQDGEVAWSRYSSDGNDSWWMTGDTIVRASTQYDFTIETLHPENGAANWQFETPFDVGSDLNWYAEFFGLVCDGKAYGGVPDNNWTGPLLVIVDPVATEVVVARGLSLRPVFMADGIMIAYDEDTDEVVAVGSVSGSLQAGGRATVTRGTTLRGAPNDAAIERAQVTTGALVEITGESETSNGMEWAPVTIADTGKSGYLPADALNGQDGSIRFEAVELSQLAQFGQLTIYPKFSPGTRAEMTEDTELRGAPSESSAGKGTVAAGTEVTVTSRPTIGASVDVEWCSVKVDATGETGWVPTTVLRLLPPA